MNDPRDADFPWSEVKMGFTVTEETIPHYIYRWVPFWRLQTMLRGDWERVGGLWPVYKIRRSLSLIDMILSSRSALQAVIDNNAFLGLYGGIDKSSNAQWKTTKYPAAGG